jgi:hypothetical protein
MKHIGGHIVKSFLVVMLLSLVSISAVRAQTENSFFLLGAEWLNYPGNTQSHSSPTVTDWTNIQNLGLNWGMVSITGPDSINRAITRLNDAAARGIHLNLSLGRRFAKSASGRRWQYHPEYDSNMVQSGRVGAPDNDASADKMPEQSSNAPKAWKADILADPAGYIISGIVRDAHEYEPDSSLYYVKIRTRLDGGGYLSSTPVLRVTASAIRQSSCESVS